MFSLTCYELHNGESHPCHEVNEKGRERERKRVCVCEREREREKANTHFRSHTYVKTYYRKERKKEKEKERCKKMKEKRIAPPYSDSGAKEQSLPVSRHEEEIVFSYAWSGGNCCSDADFKWFYYSLICLSISGPVHRQM